MKMKVWIRCSSFGEFLKIPKVWEIMVNILAYISSKNWFTALIRWDPIWFSPLSSKGPRAKHFLERSEYIKLIAPNGTFGLGGPIRLFFGNIFMSNFQVQFGKLNQQSYISSLPYQNSKRVLKCKNKRGKKSPKSKKQTKCLWAMGNGAGYHT